MHVAINFFALAANGKSIPADGQSTSAAASEKERPHAQTTGATNKGSPWFAKGCCNTGGNPVSGSSP